MFVRIYAASVTALKLVELKITTISDYSLAALSTPLCLLISNLLNELRQAWKIQPCCFAITTRVVVSQHVDMLSKLRNYSLAVLFNVTNIAALQLAQLS